MVCFALSCRLQRTPQNPLARLGESSPRTKLVTGASSSGNKTMESTDGHKSTATAGYRSDDSHKRMKRRLWVASSLAGTVQLSLPLLVLLALFATVFSECAEMWSGPKVDAQHAVIHKDRIHFTVNEPTEVEGQRRVALMSVDPSHGEPKLEKELAVGEGANGTRLRFLPGGTVRASGNEYHLRHRRRPNRWPPSTRSGEPASLSFRLCTRRFQGLFLTGL